MKILIITYSREVNPGTFLQAYGVQHAFSEMFPGAQIELLKHRRLHSIGAEQRDAVATQGWWQFVKAKARAIPRRLKYEWAYRTWFRLTDKEFDLFDYDEEEFRQFASGYDLIVVGSDTILNRLERYGRYGLMWLMGVNRPRVLFAASAAPASFSVSERQRADLLRSLSSFMLLGVRDETTRRLLADKIGLGSKVFCQYDPTYLIPEEKFCLSEHISHRLERVRKHRPIALVNFALTNCPFKQELTVFVKQQGYYVVSTLYNEQADCNLMSLSPFEWAALFRHIDLAVTERFHDSVFTLRNSRPVVAIDWNTERFAPDGSSKTSDLLRLYGLQGNHFIATSVEEVQRAMRFIADLNPREQCEAIRQHNVEIISDYHRIVERIKIEIGECARRY